MKYIFIVFSLLFSISLYANEEAASENLEIFNKLTKDIIDQVVDHINVEHKRWIYIQNIDSLPSENWFVESVFLNVLNEQGFDSIGIAKGKKDKKILNGVSGKHPVIIEFKIIQLDAAYQSKASFWKSPDVNRTIQVELWTRIYQFESGSVLWSGNVRNEYSDVIKWKYLSEVENPNIRFTQGILPAASTFKRIVEPSFIIGLTGTVIYLFYSLRSN